MNREIKFRAWHNIIKEFLYEGWTTKENGSETYSSKTTLFMLGESAEIMQFTGVLDKNDKEIYEGDIIIAANGQVCEVKFGEWSFSENQYEGTVTYSGIGFSFGGKEPFGESVGKSYEIIGNIYENQNLLT